MPSVLSCLQGLPSYTEAMNEMQKIALAANRAAFSLYKDIFKEKDVVIVGTGPTINFYKKIENAVYIGVNSSILLYDIDIDYYFCIDYSHNVELTNEYNLAKYIFYGKNLPYWPNMIPDRCIGGHATKFYANYSEKNVSQYNFSEDISTNMLAAPKSIIFNAMLFALYANPKRIFLAGCDCGASQLTADGSQKTSSANLDYVPLIEGWKAIKHFADRQYPETEIISINPRGLAGVFRDEYQNIEAVKAVEAKDRGEMASALEHARLALTQDPDNSGLLSLVADLQRTLSEEDFLTTVESGLVAQPEWADGYRQMALYQESQNGEEMALDWARKGTERYPQDLTMRLFLGQLLRRLNRTAELEEMLAQSSSAFRSYWAFSLFRQTWWNSNLTECIALDREALGYANEFFFISYYMIMALRSIGDNLAAESAIKDALAEEPDNAAAYRLLAWIALARGKPTQALQYARQMWKLAPGWTYSTQLMLQVLLRLDRLDEALALAREIQAVTPDEDFLPYYLAKIFQARGELDTAVAHAREAVYRYPILRERYRLEYVVTYANLLQKKGEINEAEAVLRDILNLHSDSSQIWRTLSSLYAFKGDRAQAVACAREAVGQEPSINENWLHLANILQSQREWDEADEILKARLEVTPSWGAGWRKRSELCEARKQENWEEESLAYARKAVETDPHHTGHIRFLIEKVKKKSKAAAIMEYETALNDNPDWGFGWALLSIICGELKDHQSAVHYARKAVMISPEDPWCLVRLTDLLLANKELDAAEREARIYLELYPQNGIVCRQMARVCKARNQTVQAFLWLKKACLLAPLATDTLWAHLIALLRDMKDTSAEKHALRQAVRYNPQWRSAYRRLIQLCTNDEEKCSLYREAVTFNPCWPELWYQLSLMTDASNKNKGV